MSQPRSLSWARGDDGPWRVYADPPDPESKRPATTACGIRISALKWQEAMAFMVPVDDGASSRGRSDVCSHVAHKPGRHDQLTVHDTAVCTRLGRSKVKDRSWYEREAWRFDRR